ncbi:MAG TPA: hypothetical protein EYN54_03225 [Methylococcaceae bacterium]|nr:hypothetical protein [Methylococcaceae bacterium]
MTNWEKERLTEQLKFFGAKKTKFISCYAKKPRVRIKVKDSNSAVTDLMLDGVRRNGLDYIRSSQFAGQQAALGFNQLLSNQQAMDAQRQSVSQTANIGSCGLIGISNGSDARAMGQSNHYIPYLGGWCG